MANERFMRDPQNFIGVMTPSYVFIGIADRSQFDLIDLPCRDDGETDLGHVLVKTVATAKITLVFQHWLKSRTADALLADRLRDHGAKGA